MATDTIVGGIERKGTPIWQKLEPLIERRRNGVATNDGRCSDK